MKALQIIWTPARTIGAIALVGMLALGACSSSGVTSSGSGSTAATATVAASGSNGDTTAPPTAADALASNVKASYVEDSDWKASDAVDVTLSGTTVTSSSDAVSVSDGVLTISKAGVYKLSGSFTGKVVVAAGAEDQVVLILDNATITSSTGAAIEATSSLSGSSCRGLLTGWSGALLPEMWSPSSSWPCPASATAVSWASSPPIEWPKSTVRSASSRMVSLTAEDISSSVLADCSVKSSSWPGYCTIVSSTPSR